MPRWFVEGISPDVLTDSSTVRLHRAPAATTPNLGPTF